MKINKIKSLALIIIVLIPSLFMNIGLVFAEDQSVLLQDFQQQMDKILATATYGECKDVLTAAYDIETMKFLSFLEQNFQNKSSNESLLNIAIARYSEYKQSLDEIFGKLLPATSGSQDSTTYMKEIGQITSCIKLSEAYKQLAKEHMIAYIKNTNYQKKATVLIEKYQSINGKIRELHFAIAQMYGFFMTFRNKLPGFLQKCITK